MTAISLGAQFFIQDDESASPHVSCVWNKMSIEVAEKGCYYPTRAADNNAHRARVLGFANGDGFSVYDLISWMCSHTHSHTFTYNCCSIPRHIRAV